MVGMVDRAVVVADAAREYNAYEPTVRRNVAVLFARIKREGGYDTFALADLAARKAGGHRIEGRETRGADRHAAKVVLDSLDALGDSREAVRMLKRVATLLHAVVGIVSRLPASERAEAMDEAVALAVAEMPVRRDAPAQAARHP